MPVELAPAVAAPVSAEPRVAPASWRIGTAPVWVFLAWTAFGLLFSFAVYWEVRTHGHSPSRIVAYTLLVWYWWAAVTPVVSWLGHREPILPLSWRAAALHIGAAIALGIVHGVWWTALSVWMKPFDSMGLQVFWPDVVSLVRGRMFFEVMIYAALLAGSLLVTSQHRLREREVAAAQLEASLAQARLHALELQIQPHFLFNTLHAIGGLVRQSRSTEAVEMIAGLSELLRYSLDHAGGHVVPLGRELDVLGRYLGIQQLRIGDRLSIEIDVPPGLRFAAVPAMILQPLAENAIRHGIDTAPGAGRLRLTARREGDALALELFNTSGGATFARAGVGLRNTQARLRQLYGDRSSFTLEGGRDGVTARLTLPYEESRA